MPAPSTAENATSAIPIMSAAAVAAVRPGLRIALRRASPPAAPAIRWPGRPSTDARRGTSRGEISATAMNSSSEPGASSARRPSASMPGANMPSPSTVERQGARDRREQRSAAADPPGRDVGALAHRGDRRDARRPQRRAEAGEDGDDDPDGERDDDRPRAEHRARRRAGRCPPTRTRRSAASPGRRRPRGPISEATVPIASASTTTDRSTCRRVAPSARSSASSRERCATVIESVL